MNLLTALRLMVRNYPAGIPGLASILGKSPETLRKELEGSQGHKLGAIDASIISEECMRAGSEHCDAYLNAIAVNSGRLMQLPVREQGHALHHSLAEVVKEASDVLNTGIAAMADGRITANELKRIEREVGDLVASAQNALTGARAAHEAGKPAHLRAAT